MLVGDALVFCFYQEIEIISECSELICEFSFILKEQMGACINGCEHFFHCFFLFEVPHFHSNKKCYQKICCINPEPL